MAGARALILLAALLIAACSLDYEEVRVAEDMAEQIPETVMTRFTHTIVSEGKVWVKLSAERAESYGKRKQILLRGVRFQEFDAQGKLVTEAWADRAVYFTESEDATASGAVSIRAPQEKAALRAEALSWTKEGKRLEGGSGERVRLEKEDGSFVEGQGFRADFRRRRLEFGSSVRGFYVVEEEEGGNK